MKKILIFIMISTSWLFANSVKESLFDHHRITKISPKELIHFINTNQGQKPLFVFLSAEDGGCKPCDYFNQTIVKVADKRAGDMEFVYVRFSHYQDVNNYPKIIKKFHILGMPTSLIIHKNKILDSTFGNTKQKRIETTIDAALQKINGGVRAIVEKGIKPYLDANSYKAIYVAVDNPNSYIVSSSIGKKSPLDAVFEASKKCIKESTEKSLIDRCKVYMIEDEVVYGRDEQEIRELLKSLSPVE